MGIHTQAHLREQILFGSMAGMLVCLFVSRGGLSICMIVFIATAILDRHILQQVKKCFTTLLLAGICLLFLIPFVSGLWSSNLTEWSAIVRIKLPLLLLPIAFAGRWSLPRNWWLALAVVFLMALFAATLWSVFYYAQHWTAVNESYLKAKTIPTPLGNDHVRFSWLVSAGVLLCTLLLQQQKRFKILLGLLLFWLALYLHLLAARTGLFSFYIMILGYALYTLWHQKNVLKSFYGLGVLLLLPVIAFLFLPTFQNRVKYFVYDYDFMKRGTYLPGANDGARLQSYKAGWALLQKAPMGVGAGDVRDETHAWYAQHLPNMIPTDRLLPSSEWALYGGFAGWPGVVLFTLVMLLPLYFAPCHHRIYWWLLNVTLAASLLFDVGLEVQYGVFIYSFFVLWWWKWFMAPHQLNRHEV